MVSVAARSPHRHWGCRGGEGEGSEQAPCTPVNVPLGQAGAEQELHEPALALQAAASRGGGGGVPIVAADAATAGNLKTLPESRGGRETERVPAGSTPGRQRLWRLVVAALQTLPRIKRQGSSVRH